MHVTPAEHVPVRLWGLLAGLTFAWGFNWTAMKLALSEVSPFTFRVLCLFVGGGILMLVMRANGQSLVVPRGQRLRLVGLALVSITLWNLLIAFGVSMVPSSRAAILAYTMPAWAIPLSVWVLGERLTGRKIAGLALGMGGLALLLGEGIANLGAAPLGSLLVLAAAVGWALATVLQKRYPVDMPPGAYTAWIMLLGGVPILLCAMVFDDPAALLVISGAAWFGIAYNVLVAFAWAHWAWIRLVTELSVTAFSLSMLLTPMVGVASGMLFLGERPSATEFVAFALVMASLVSVIVPARGR
ncbi:MAG TPA: DMT family transporter [Burkholderiales bacterium]